MLCLAVVSQKVLADNTTIKFNYPLDPISSFPFNFLDDLNVSVVPYQGVKEPTVHLACLSNDTSARNSCKYFLAATWISRCRRYVSNVAFHI